MDYRIFDTMYGRVLCYHHAKVSEKEARAIQLRERAVCAQPVSGDLSIGTTAQAEAMMGEYLAHIREQKRETGKPSTGGGDWYKTDGKPDGYYYCIVASKHEQGFFGPFESDSERSLDITKRLGTAPVAYKFYLCDDNYLMSEEDFARLNCNAKRNTN